MVWYNVPVVHEFDYLDIIPLFAPFIQVVQGPKVPPDVVDNGQQRAQDRRHGETLGVEPEEREVVRGLFAKVVAGDLQEGGLGVSVSV